MSSVNIQNELCGVVLKICYENRLITTRLESLNTRRIKLDLMFVFKLISGEVDLKYDKFLQFSSTGRPNRNRRCLQLHIVNYPSNNFGRYNYFYRTHRIWNNLPSTGALRGRVQGDLRYWARIFQGGPKFWKFHALYFYKEQKI